MPHPDADTPLTDLDVFARYVLGIRRFTKAHLDAVDRYLVNSWGASQTELAVTRFLDRFVILEQRRAPIRFARKVPALIDSRETRTWRLTPAGLAAIGNGPLPADIPTWSQQLPAAGWETLLVLWCAAGEDRAQRLERLAILRTFAPAALGSSAQLVVAGRALTAAHITELATRLNPALSPVAAAAAGLGAPSRMVGAQLRWLRDGGLIDCVLWRPPRHLSEPYQYIDQWGWQWLRNAVDPEIPPLATTALISEMIDRTASYGSTTPRKVTTANLAVTVAYQRVQHLIGRLLAAYPRRWRGCAQEFTIRSVAVFGPRHVAAGLPVPAGHPLQPGARQTLRRVDGILWQAGDPWLLPSVLIEYESDPHAHQVGDHLATALHVAAVSQRETELVFVVTPSARRTVQRALADALQRVQTPALRGLWRGAQLRTRLTRWAAASQTDPLSCPALIDETIHLPARTGL